MKNIKKYWLGYQKPNAQDAFFIDALDSEQWVQGNKDDWDACWSTSMPSTKQFETLNASKTLNHIPGNSALTIKSSLYNTLNHARQRVVGLPQEAQYDFFPTTFSMPQDYFEFQQAALDQPQARWIQKPRNMSRGRGIEMVQHPETVPLDSEWIIQSYLDKPHLWNNHKYVLRCYILITSVEPLRFYWYHEGSAKLTSEEYDLDNLDNPFIHLTNPDINEHNEDAEVPVMFHSFRVYREWLKEQGIDDEKVFSDLREMLAVTVISAREKMRTQSSQISADTSGTYELIGIDCMLDSNYKPWILECNLSPSLDICSTDAEQVAQETNTKKGMVAEIVDMLGLNDKDLSELNSSERVAREMSRAKGFDCLFPTLDANAYLPYFPIPRFADIQSLPEGINVDFAHIHSKALESSEATFDDSLALLASNAIEKKSSFITPNELASWIWIQNSAGNTPDEIALELTESFGECNTEILSQASGQNVSAEAGTWLAQVWEVLAEWGQANVFTAKDQTELLFKQEPDYIWQDVGYVNIAGASVFVRSNCPIAAHYLQRFSDQKALNELVLNIDVLRSKVGYVVMSGANIISGSRKLSRLINDINQFAVKNNLAESDLGMVAGVVVGQEKAVGQEAHNMLLVSNENQLDSIAYELSLCDGNCILSGAPIISQVEQLVKFTDLPVCLPNQSSTINSRYDASNYYPNKPVFTSQHKRSLNHDWVIGEGTSQSCWMASVNTALNKQAEKIKTIVFVEENSDIGQAIVTPLKSAEALAELWGATKFKSPKTAATLPRWLNGVKAYRVQAKNLKDAKTQVDLLNGIFKR